ncbi:putative ABC transporter permease [Patescibacteria group bacterium]|nr:putative ABC transporter permease [Patescibacteria group bacterium]MBU1705273.1 putative ABC transporter permease [Patescibacteria group bacterium]
MNLTEIILSFLLYGILGWVLDSLKRSWDDRRWTTGGFTFLPFAPIYGFGALIVLFLHPVIAAWPLLFQFVFFAPVLGAFEYLGGIYCEIVFHKKLWDYSKYKINIHGRTSLFHAVSWGVLALLLIYFMHPLFFGSA